MTEKKSYYEMRKDFFQKYRNKILPLVSKYENERRGKFKLVMIVAILLSIVGTVFLYITFSSGLGSKDSEGVLKLAFLAFGGAWGFWYVTKKEFENSIKKKIMPTVCSCFGDMKWSEGSYSYGEVFTASGVIPTYSDSEYDDIFEGNYNDVKIEIIEGKYSTGSGKNRKTVFDGVIVKLDMNKEFTSHTIIKPDGFFHSSPFSHLRHTVLEDVVFEKKFDVFTNDEVDARYLITPSFMERLNNMKTAFTADSISCAFYGNLLIIALSTHKDIFSICSLVKPITDGNQYMTMYEEIVSVVKLIDHFKLDQKIGL